MVGWKEKCWTCGGDCWLIRSREGLEGKGGRRYEGREEGEGISC